MDSHDKMAERQVIQRLLAELGLENGAHGELLLSMHEHEMRHIVVRPVLTLPLCPQEESRSACRCRQLELRDPSAPLRAILQQTLDSRVSGFGDLVVSFDDRSLNWRFVIRRPTHKQ